MNSAQLSIAARKGGTAPKHTWTDEEREIVRRDYRGTTESAQLIARKLGVTPFAVKGQVQKMGIAMNKSRPWTEAEIERLEEMAERYCVTVIAHRLHRSVNAIVVKMRRLGISRRGRDGWYIKKEVGEICGVDHKKVQQWIDSGALKASYHNGRKPSNCGMAMWHIESEDFKNFLLSYSSELLGRNADIQQIIWIVTE